MKLFMLSKNIMDSDRQLPLIGITVLDLTLARAGPTAVRHFADWGANVIRIEQPILGDDITGERHGADFQNLHRNKRSMALNLKSEEGHKIFMKLASTADIIIENMRPDVKHRLKISYEDIKTINQRIIYGSISGFGQCGPYSHRPGVDQIIQGISGLMSITGELGREPMRTGIPISDLTAGNILALGCMMALFDRERTGMGRWVTTSLLESQLFMLDFQASRWTIDNETATKTGNYHPIRVPVGVYPTKDVNINIAAGSERIYERFCKTIGHEEWMTKEGWNTPSLRYINRDEINKAISDITILKSSHYWIDLFEANGIPCGPIYDINQTFSDVQVKYLPITSKMYSPHIGEKMVISSPINISGFNKDIRLHTPNYAEHQFEILSNMGYSNEQIDIIHQNKII
jgi:formyl-CoA transferase